MAGSVRRRGWTLGGQSRAATVRHPAVWSTVQRLLLPIWSPDGRRIAATDFEGRVYLLDLDEPIPPQVVAQNPTARPGLVACDWSPDGRWLATAGEEPLIDQGAEIGRLDVHTRRHEAIVTGGRYPVWLPDSRHLLVAGPHEVRRVDAETGTSRTVLTITGAEIPSAGPLAVSKDGERLVLLTEESSSTLTVFEL